MAITIHLRLYGDLARRAGRKKQQLRLAEGSSLGDLLRQAVAGGLLPADTLQRWQAGEVTGHLVVLDDEQIEFPEDLSRPLSAGDEVAIIPWIVGGERP
ncbi:MAG: MoaD/ThiS family protein [Chloroflexi bacterium]|nr:MoaD/ThiS family protein [Chloroflexota bacterium]